MADDDETREALERIEGRLERIEQRQDRLTPASAASTLRRGYAQAEAERAAAEGGDGE
jgi:hypothetical protein